LVRGVKTQRRRARYQGDGMTVKIGNAPVSWGVFYGDDPNNPDWSWVLDEVSATGFKWVELGPIGFCPEDAERLAAEYERRGLTLVGDPPVLQRLEDKAADHNREVTHRTCKLLQSLGGRYFNIIPKIGAERIATAGRGDASRRLDRDEWKVFMDAIREAATVARGDYGLTPVLHPHSATYLEYADEIDLAFDMLEPELVGMCLDTGHQAYADVEPVALYRKYHERVHYMHFKSIDAAVHASVVERGVDFDSAVGEGVFCSLADGAVDFPALKLALEEHGYDGWATIEQDADPSSGGDPSDDARRSLAFLRETGIAD
jgi:inosose dehydratase